MVVEFSVIIAAGGKGLRFEGAVPKQFMELGDKPVLMHSVETFCRHGNNTDIVIVVPDGEEGNVTNMLSRRGCADKAVVTAGGAERQDSVMKGFEKLGNREANHVVAVHDGARPFVSENLIERVVEKASFSGAAVPVLPVTDTVVRLMDGKTVGGYPDRRGLMRIQTPQAYHFGVLDGALTKSAGENRVFTDESSMVHAFGGDVHIVAGDPLNLKITDGDDFKLARLMMERLCTG